MMHRRDGSGQIIPLYSGRAGIHGRGGANLSANFLGIDKDVSRFARWSAGYAYLTGELSASACPGQAANKIVQKYRRWAERLFCDSPAWSQMLRRPAYFRVTAWSPQSYSIWHDFGSCLLAFEKYLLIGVASELYPHVLLNDEGVNRPASVSGLSAAEMKL